MRTIKYTLIAVISLFFMSCKSVIIQQDYMTTTTQHMTLGSIGASHTTFTMHDYNALAFPKYQSPIKLRVTSSIFNNATFKAFQKAQQQQQRDIVINYADSIDVKPRFLKLEIADHVAVISALNHTNNKGAYDILSFQEEAGVITSVSLALDTKHYKTLRDAESVFLEMQGKKDYVLKIYTNQQLTQKITLKEGVIFAFNTSNACWKQNEKFKLDIVTLADSKSNCPKKTFKSAKRAQKKINYFKL